MEATIRPIAPQDDAAVEQVIRTCLIEFGANRPGTAWEDPNLSCFSAYYSVPGRRYWVALDESGTLVGGVGIGELSGVEGVCELQKMYCLPCARGSGIARQLMDEALAFARRHYSACYLETFDNMRAAQRFYEKCGFLRVAKPLGATGHFSCDVRYLLKFTS